jgi:hypothetical protein
MAKDQREEVRNMGRSLRESILNGNKEVVEQIVG